MLDTECHIRKSRVHHSGREKLVRKQQADLHMENENENKNDHKSTETALQPHNCFDLPR